MNPKIIERLIQYLLARKIDLIDTDLYDYKQIILTYLKKLMCRNICSANSRIEQDFSLLPSRIESVKMTSK